MLATNCMEKNAVKIAIAVLNSKVGDDTRNGMLYKKAYKSVHNTKTIMQAQ